jgi:predicted sulfurtransferase
VAACMGIISCRRRNIAYHRLHFIRISFFSDNELHVSLHIFITCNESNLVHGNNVRMAPLKTSKEEQQEQQQQQHGAVILFYKYLQPTADWCNSNKATWLLQQFPEFYLDKIYQFQKDLCSKLGLKGRVLLASEGINGTLSGISSDILQQYCDAMDQFDLIEYCGIPRTENHIGSGPQTPEESDKNSSSNSSASGRIFAGIDWKQSSLLETSSQEEISALTAQSSSSSPSPSPLRSNIVEPFPDLKISIVKELVSTGGAVSVDDITQFGGTHLTPEQFHRKLVGAAAGQREKEVVLIDVRNTFEYDIGHFVNPISQEEAINPEMVTFSSFDHQFCQQYATSLQNKTVLMYCTGGIRCEKASAMLKKRGVQDVFQLQGGIHRYLETFGDSGCFHGRNFVFDQRVSLTPSEQYQQRHQDDPSSGDEKKQGNHKNSLPEQQQKTFHQQRVVGKCVECKSPFDEISGSRVCTVCRDLVLVCPTCQVKLREYHCRRHAAWKSCYFTFLEVFNKDQLQHQKLQLEQLLLQQKHPKNVRRTLNRQVEKIQDRLQEIQDHPELVNPDAPRRCRTCRETSDICNGLCWGFWKITTPMTVNQKHDNTQLSADASNASEPLLPIQVGDKVSPGPDWNEIRFGNPTNTNTGRPLEGTVVELKSWGSGSLEQECVAVHWDDQDQLPRRRQPQVFRWGFRALNGVRMYDVQHV